MEKNHLYYGDNLLVLREHIKDESVDLIYLDPPFNSRQDYNVLFAEKSGERSASQIMAFEDTWEWNTESARACEEIIERGGRVSEAIQAFRTFLGNSDMMAYLAMMAPRLIELHRVLRETGSMYLHCDPTASHYLKMLMDAVFGPQYFRNEITWKRSHAHSDSKQGRKAYGNVADILLYYTKGDDYVFRAIFMPYEQAYIDKYYRYRDPDGRRYWLDNLTGPGGASKGNPYYEVMGVSRYWRYSKQKMSDLIAAGRVVQSKPGNVPQYKRYLDEMPGLPLQNIWADIDPINMMAKERLGYQTQKPETLLERIVRASSNEGDIVLDPFCGCGTAVSVAQRLNRRWIGIDITHLAIGLIKTRLADAFGDSVRDTYEVIGEPVDLAGAEKLAEEDKYQFQWWALSLVGARPLEKKKGADQGIDGRLYFHDEAKGGKTKQIIFSVKGGHLQASHVRDLRGVIEREKADIGVLISMESPTKPMLKEAAEAGFYQVPGLRDKYPRLQILSIAQLLEGKRVEFPRFAADATFKRAPKARKAAEEQIPLGGGEIEEPF
jgi:DNA modification methylase